jgi:hypothetical protein
MPIRPITEKEYQVAAKLLNCEVNVLKAVAAVESNGSGFLPDSRIKILFEPHIFWRLLKDAGKLTAIVQSFKYNKFKDILYERQGLYPYGKYTDQWNKVLRAGEIDLELAYKACSWGKFQPLGMYHRELGFYDVLGMKNRFEISEYEQLLGFVRMIKSRKLDDELRRKDWAGFSLAYNGKSFKKFHYDTKLAALYKKLVSSG